jgi:hypothetical protein
MPHESVLRDHALSYMLARRPWGQCAGLHGAMSRLTPPGDFMAYIAALRAEHGRKRNLMALLDRARW